MLSFENDYSEGAHEIILQHLIDTNMEQLPGYGTDHYCESAKEKIKEACGCKDADVFLLTGGTQTNQIIIDTVLAPYEGLNLQVIKFWNCRKKKERSRQQISEIL